MRECFKLDRLLATPMQGLLTWVARARFEIQVVEKNLETWKKINHRSWNIVFADPQ